VLLSGVDCASKPLAGTMNSSSDSSKTNDHFLPVMYRIPPNDGVLIYSV
jgi:hypothetical protein